MSEIAILAGIATIGAAATYTAWPFLTGTVDEREYLEAGPEEEIEDRLVYLEDRAQAALARLDEKRLSHSPQAYQSEKKRLQRALKLIDRHFDALQAGCLPSDSAIADLEDEILAEIDEPTDALLEKAEEAATPETPAASRSKTRTASRDDSPLARSCPSCGHRELDADAAFCGRCGAALTCRSCGQPIRDPEAAFCGRCGGPLRSGQG